jgi:hypothetical protein
MATMASGCLGCLWTFILMAVPMTPPAAVSDLGGRRYHCLLTAAALLARTYLITGDCAVCTLASTCWGKGVIRSCRFLKAVALQTLKTGLDHPCP